MPFSVEWKSILGHLINYSRNKDDEKGFSFELKTTTHILSESYEGRGNLLVSRIKSVVLLGVFEIWMYKNCHSKVLAY